MYFCLICQDCHHLDTNTGKMFRTGFRSFPNGEKLPLGVCLKRTEQVSVSNKKVS